MRITLLLILSLFISGITKAATYYVATTGSDSNPGTISAPFKTWEKLNSVLVAGDIAYIRGGTYNSTKSASASVHVMLQNLHGTSANTIKVWAYPGEKPVLDLTSIGVPTYSDPTGMILQSCTYVHVKGIRVTSLRQVSNGNGVSRGFTLISSNNCTVEQVEVDNIGGSGYKLESSNDNLLLNCDGHHVGDGLTDGGGDGWDNADAFSISGGDPSTRNTFDGCRAWMSSDDGWDFFNTNGINYIKNCWSFWNGLKPWGTSNAQVTPTAMTGNNYSTWHGNSAYAAGSGEGFKLGPANSQNFGLLTKYVSNCVSFENRGTGYASNSISSLTTKHQFYNNIAYKNDNDGFSYGAGWSVGATQTFKNNWAWNNNQLTSGADWVYDGLNGSISNNFWGTTYGGINLGNLNGSVSISNADFLSVSSAGVDGARQSDGSLPNLSFLKLAPTSDLINKGVNVGLPYTSSAPDMGAFESNGTATNLPPTANAGADQTIILPTNTASLTGSGTDPDGSISAYSWTKVSGPTGGTISSASSASTTVTGLVQGTYQFQLQVTDNSGATSTDIVQVAVNASAPTNTPPTANAGADKIVTLPTNSVSLTGSGTDPGGSISAYLWTKISGPAGGTLSAATAATTNATALIEGVYKFELRVTDNAGATGKDTVQVTVNAASGGANNAYGGTRWAIPGTIEAENFDNGGQNAAYYDNSNGNNGGAYRPSDYVDITAATEGGNLVGWVVAGEWMKYSVNVTTAGTYSIQVRAASGVAGSIQVEMDGTVIATIAVPNTGGSQSMQSVTVANINLTAGNKIMRIYAVSSSINLNYFTFTKTSGGNALPTANAGVDKTVTLPTSTVSLAGSGTDADGTIASYAWTKVSGPAGGTLSAATSATTNATALVQGVYKFELKVTDNAGGIGRDTVQVTVNAAGNTPPIANAGVDKTVVLPTSTTTLTGAGTDANGTITAYAWTKVSGPTGGTIATATAATTSISALIQGVYKFELKVTDNGGAIGRDTVQVTVNAASSPGNAYGGVRWAIPGTIEAENFDLGGQNAGYYDNTNGNNGGVYRTSDYVDIAAATEGGYLVGWITAGEWLKYSVNVTTAATYTITARVASPSSGQTFRIEMDGTTIATVTVPNTGGSQSFQTVTINNVILAAGDKTMRIYAVGAGFNINKITFTAGASTKIAGEEEPVTDAGTRVSTFPLPFSTSTTVSLYGETQGLYKLNLVNVSGNSVWKKDVNKAGATHNETIYMGNLPAGVYILQVISPDQKKTTQQIIKN